MKWKTSWKNLRSNGFQKSDTPNLLIKKAIIHSNDSIFGADLKFKQMDKVHLQHFTAVWFCVLQRNGVTVSSRSAVDGNTKPAWYSYIVMWRCGTEHESLQKMDPPSTDMLPKAWIQLISYGGDMINLTAVSHLLKKADEGTSWHGVIQMPRFGKKDHFSEANFTRRVALLLLFIFPAYLKSECWTLISRVGSTILTKHLTQQRCFCQYTLYCQLPLVGTFPTGK